MTSNSERTSPAATADPPAAAAVNLDLGPLMTVSVLLLVAGLVGFFVAFMQGASARAWQAFLVNLLFWMGLAQGGVVASAAFYLTQARWAGSTTYRLAEAFAGFLPIGFVLFWGLYLGRTEIFPWILHPVSAQKAKWLNTPFLFARDGIGLFVMTALSLWFVRSSRRADVQRWARNPDNIVLPPNVMRRLSPAVALCFAGIYSLIGFDLVMSLSPVWRSTLFGAYFFASVFWAALVAMSLTAVLMRSRLGSSVFSSPTVLHDLGKLVFAFSIFWIYLTFAQYLVIWYGDIPVETFFIVERTQVFPWSVLGWSVPIMVWLIPFVVLLGRRPKCTPAILGSVAALGLAGIWLEMYVLVVPSLSPRTIPFGWVEALVTIGFAGAFFLCCAPGLKLVAQSATSGHSGELR